ncbi:putative Thioredoxin [Candidatus Bilamarchaeum dharawalense]|uniref:Putative Thioredoxin n=1 Tax=Candidatus Bilamarchaeum dharawalense TaxID=2885759 RepID=A0A5E4LQH1_9ARCH|nr:putative Thioredoxin [Candidatus Bilamarchaeum dharawalense]
MTSQDELEKIRKKKLQELRNMANEPEVIVYSTPSCPYCVRAKEYLTARGIKYKDYDVSVDRNKAKEMVEASGQMGVPVLQINGRVIVGFNRPLIDDALSKKPLMKREDLIQNIAFDPFSK